MRCNKHLGEDDYHCTFGSAPATAALRVSLNQASAGFDVRHGCWPLGKKGLVKYMGVSLNGGTPKTPPNDHFQ